MSETKLGIVLDAKDQSSAAFKALTASVKELKAGIESLNAVVTQLKAQGKPFENQIANLKEYEIALEDAQRKLGAFGIASAKVSSVPPSRAGTEQYETLRERLVETGERRERGGLEVQRGVYVSRSESARREISDIVAQMGALRELQAVESISGRERPRMSMEPQGATAVQGAEWAKAYNAELERQARLLSTANIEAQKYKTTLESLKSQTLNATSLGETGAILAQREATKESERIAAKSGRVESEAAIGSAGTEYETNAIANAEALADAKKRQAAAQELANRQTAQEAIFQREALGTSYEMNAAANIEAAALNARIANEQSYRESIKSRTEAEEGYLAKQKYEESAVREKRTRGGGSSIEREELATINAAGEEFEKLNRASSRTRSGIDSAGRSLRGFSRDAVSASSATSTLGYILGRTAVEFGEMARHARGQQISSFFATLRRVGSMGALSVGGPIAAVMGAIELSHVTQQMGELAEKTLNAAASAGMGVEQYSRLQRTLQLISGDSSHIVTVFGTMSQGIEEALSGTGGPKAGAFAQILGPGWAQELTKDLNNPLALLDQLRQRFQALGPSLQTTEIYRRALGRGFQELMPIIRLTQQEWEEYTKSAQSSGSVMDQQTAQALAKVSIEGHKLGEELSGLGIAFAKLAGGTGIISFLSSVVHGLREIVEASASATEAIGRALQPKAGYGARRFEPREEQAAPPVGHYERLGRWRVWRSDLPSPSADAPREGTADRGGARPIPPTPGKSPDAAPELHAEKAFYDRGKLEQELNKRVEALTQASALEQKQYQLQIAQAGDNLTQVTEIETRRLAAIKTTVDQERALRQSYVGRITQMEDVRPGTPGGAPEAVERIESKTGLQQKDIEAQIQSTEKLRQLQRQDYEKFADNERLKIQTARGNWSQIASIYQEWINTITAKYPQLVKEFENTQREMVRAAQEANDKLISDRSRLADAEASSLKSQARIGQMEREVKTLSEPGSDRTANISGLRQEIAEIQSYAAQEISLYQDIANASGATTEQKIENLVKAKRAAEEAGASEIAIGHKIAEEQKKAAEESSKVFVEFFNKTGSEIDGLLDAAIFKTKTRQQALHDFFLEIDKTVIHSVETIGSQLAAQGLAKLTGTQLEPGKGLGDLLGSMVGKALGLGEKPDAQAGVIAAQNATTSQVQAAKDILGQIRGLLDRQKAENAQVQQTLGQTTGAGTSYSPGGVVREGLPSAQESDILAQIKRRESASLGPMAYQSMHYAVPGQPLPKTLEDVERAKVTGKSHAFGAYGFQPGTYREMAAITGRGDISPQSQDINALQLLRTYGPNDPHSWQASMPRGGYQSNASGSTGPVPVTVTNPEAMRGQTTAAGPVASTMVPGGAIPSVDIARVGGTDIGTSGALPTLSPDLTQPIKTSQPPNPISQFLDYGLFGRQLGLEKPVFWAGGTVEGFQGGGMPGLSPPNNSDTVLAWLTPGERVLNLRETGEYHKQFGGKGILGYQDGGIAENILGSTGQQYMSSSSTPPSIAGSIDPSLRLLKAGDRSSPEFQQAMSVALGFGPRSVITNPMTVYRGGIPERYRSLGRSPAEGIDYSFIGIPQFQSGGLTSIHQGAFETVPVRTESRGFLTPHLVQVYPQPKLGPLLAILGVGAALAGVAAIIAAKDKDEKLAKKLLATPDIEGGTTVTSRTTTPLGPEGERAFPDSSGVGWYRPGENIVPGWSSGHSGGMAGALPGFQKGGVSEDILSRLRSDEVPAILLKNERVLSPQETKTYDSLPKFHSGGFVWPAFQTGGTVEDSPTYSPGVVSRDSGSDTKSLSGSVASLSSGLSTLSQDVSKVTSGFSALEKATGPAASTTGGFLSELKTVSGALSSFTSILNAPKEIGSAISGLGGIIGTVGGIFGLEQGGIIPSAAGGMVVGGLPKGTLSLLHPQEMVLPANISNFVQGAAASYTGTQGGPSDFSSGDIHNTINISGVVNSHDVGRLFMQHFGSVMKAFQRGARNNFESP